MREASSGRTELATLRVLILVPLLFLGGLAGAQPFSFSAAQQQEEEKERAAEQQRAQAIQQLVSVPCRARLKDRKILQLVAERADGGWQAQQDRYQPLISILDARLKALGLKTYTQEQIKAAVAQAEIDAYFNNDPDGALAASKRLAAQYILKGDITTKAGVNPAVGVNEVAVDVQLVLMSTSGREISRVEGHLDSYSGHDTLATAAALLRQQADQLVAQLYNDYCRKAERP